MNFLKYFIFALLTIYILAMLILSVRSQKLFKYLFFNALLGIFVLIILYFSNAYTGLSLQKNQTTIGVSGIFGIVGVIGLLLFNLIV